MIDVTSGGTLMDKELVASRQLISNMAKNSQQFNFRALTSSKGVSEVIVVANNQRIENKLIKLISFPLNNTSKSKHQISVQLECVAYASLQNILPIHATLFKRMTKVFKK
ncbi:hypothetical protein CR513_36798, partial [Mucuna pruriens]